MSIDVHILEHELSRRIGSLATNPVVRLRWDSSLQEAATRLRLADVSLALVGTETLSIVTERDITRAMADGADPDLPVTTYVERTPMWVTKTGQVSDVLQIMGRYEVLDVLVIDTAGEAVGVISMREIVTALFGASIGK